jgi:hypothetical protein
LPRGCTLPAKLITPTLTEVDMTTLNTNTKIEKSVLMDMIGKPVLIKSFKQPQEYFPMKSGFYFIDSVIFHYNDHVELGISEYNPETTIKDFDIDKSHIGFYSLEELDISISNQNQSLNN